MLQGKTAIVTGSSRGIGKSIATKLAKLGASVVVNGTNAQLLNEVASSIRNDGNENVTAYAGDVCNKAVADDLIRTTVNTYGGVDILVTNAGVTDIATIDEVSEERWDRIIDINLKGTFLMCQAAVPHLRKAKAGRIVTIGSDAALQGMKYLVPYSASKFAVRGLTQALAKEVGEDGITVNCICPGIIDTDMWEETDRELGRLLQLQPGEAFRMYTEGIPIGRPGVPDDIANVVAFLVSDEAAYITGASIPVGGGTSPN